MSAAVRRRDVGEAQGGGSAGGSRNAVGDELYMETSVNCGTVGGITPHI